MAAIREPKISLTITGANLTPTVQAQKVLFVGQMITGTATAGTLVENVGVTGEENALFGAHSHIAGMIRAARKINKITQFDALPLADNGSGVAATGTLVFAGTASAAGDITVSVGSSENYTYTLTAAVGTTAAQLGTALVAAITADTRVPVSAALSTATVTFTALNAGTIGNTIGLKVSAPVAGITMTLTAMASGATDPVLTTVFDPVADLRYQTIVWPSKYTNSTVTTFLESRFNVDNNVLDGEAITTVTATYANSITALAALNKKTLTYFPNKLVSSTYYKGSAIFELDDEISSQFAAIRALRFSKDADISSLVVGGDGALDNFGGISIASLPYHNTPLVNLPVIPTGLGFTAAEQSAITLNGGALLGNNSANSEIICGRVVSTYKTNSAGDVDPSFTFLEYIDTISVSREYFVASLRAQFSQSRLTSGDIVKNRKMASPETIKASCMGIYTELSKLALTQGGETALAFYKQNLSVSVDMSIGRVTILMLLPIVTQLRDMIGVVQLSFTDFS